MDHYHTLKESDLVTADLLFASVPSLFLIPSAYKNLSFLYSFSELLSIGWMECCLIHEVFYKANKKFKVYSVEFFFF